MGNSKCIPINIKNEIIKDKINKEHIISDQNEIKRLKIAYGFIEDDIIEEDDDIFENGDKKKFEPLEYCPLITTRGFGDLQYKDNKLIKIEDQYISVEPEIIEIPIEDLNYLILENYGSFGENKNNKLTINQTVVKYFLDKINSNKNKKISEIIEEFFEETLKEKEKNMEDEENIINNFACIIINFKHETNNNLIKEENTGNDKVIENKDKEDKNTNVINSDKNNKNEDVIEEEEN